MHRSGRFRAVSPRAMETWLVDMEPAVFTAVPVLTGLGRMGIPYCCLCCCTAGGGAASFGSTFQAVVDPGAGRVDLPADNQVSREIFVQVPQDLGEAPPFREG
ncbi:hypothetical protein DL762_008797 [Monosporascus cannonballus]|uniref:Uncharacterized protein n=1 Tax=Monosporascus cannonballus TaxID=155416 RepID=A0ABY0GZR0_9PEZI|nr:hypothetical protein DL762_008797 [Monosporascus cannonballus]